MRDRTLSPPALHTVQIVVMMGAATLGSPCSPGWPSSRVGIASGSQSPRIHADSRPESIGLGLFVSRTLAELMGGALVYHTNGASSFVLTLPAAPV